MTPHPLKTLLELIGLGDDTPPVTITPLRPLPTASGSNLWQIQRNLFGGGRSIRRPIPRHQLPTKLTAYVSAVRRLRRPRSPQLFRPELHDGHDLDAKRAAVIVPELARYITAGGDIPRPFAELDGFGVNVRIVDELAALADNIEPHRLAERWRSDDLAAAWLGGRRG